MSYIFRELLLREVSCLVMGVLRLLLGVLTTYTIRASSSSRRRVAVRAHFIHGSKGRFGYSIATTPGNCRMVRAEATAR